jgi:hypothetical protein
MSITSFLCDDFNFESKILHSCMACLVVTFLVSFLKYYKTFFVTKVHNMFAIMLDPGTKACNVCKEFVGEGFMFHKFYFHNVIAY